MGGSRPKKFVSDSGSSKKSSALDGFGSAILGLNYPVWRIQYLVFTVLYNMWVMCVWPSLCYYQWARDQPFRTRTQLTAGKMSTKASWWHVRGVKETVPGEINHFFYLVNKFFLGFLWTSNNEFAKFLSSRTYSRIRPRSQWYCPYKGNISVKPSLRLVGVGGVGYYR